MIFRNRTTALGICGAIALLTTVVRHQLWHLGDAYWLTLESLVILQIGVSALALSAYRKPWPFVLCVVILLIIGQFWAIENVAAVIIWRLGKFGP